MNTLNKSPVPDWHRTTVLVCILIALSLGFPFIRTVDLLSDNTVADASFAEGSLLMQAIFGPAFLLAAWLAWRHGTWTLHVLRRANPFLLLVILWAAATVFWSPYPFVTIKRAVQLVGLLLIGVTLTLPFLRTDLFTRFLSQTLTLLLVLSVFAVVLVPQIGIDPLRENGWRGILWHKNTLGVVACFASLLWVYRLSQRSCKLHLGVTALLFTLVMLVMSRSSTALVSGLIGIGTYQFMRRRYLASGHYALSVACLGLFAFVLGLLLLVFLTTGRLPTWNGMIQPLLIALNKSPDLTGRTELWALVMLDVARHPVAGIGYGAFWLNVGSPSQYVIDALHWIPLQSHNGYIDILNELGMIGTFLFAALLIWHTASLVRLSRIDRDTASLHWSFFLLILISNLAETQFLSGVLFQNCLFIYSSIIVSARLAAARAPSPQAAAPAITPAFPAIQRP